MYERWTSAAGPAQSNGARQKVANQKWPKLPQNRRNKSRGSPRKSQRIPKILGKWPKTFPQCKVKMLQKSKNSQKSAKIGKNYQKNRFSLQQLPKKGHFLKEMHQKNNRLRRKKNVKVFFAPSARHRCDPPPGCYRISVFCASALIPKPGGFTYPACSCSPPLHFNSLEQNGSQHDIIAPMCLSPGGAALANKGSHG